MKILYVISGTGMQGGATKSFFAMADGIARAGHEIRIVAPDERGVTMAARERGWKVLVVPYRFCALPSWQTWRDRLMFLPRLYRIYTWNRKARKVVNKYAEEYQPDIVHDNTSVTDIGYHAARHIGAIHITHVREYGWKDFKLMLPGLSRRLRYENGAMIAITDDLRILRGKSLPESRQRTIYNGVVSTSQIGYNPEKEGYFLYAGRITRAKGCADLTEAYIKYCKILMMEGKTPLRLIMAGSINHEPELIESIKSKLIFGGLDEYVEMTGEIQDVEKYMTRAAATIIPSHREGFGRVMPEAMAAGSLCIARDTGGTSEQLANGRRATGREIALSFKATDQLVAIMLEVDSAWRRGDCFEQDGEYHKMIKASQEAIRKYYLKEDVGKKTLQFYKEILKQNSQEQS